MQLMMAHMRTRYTGPKGHSYVMYFLNCPYLMYIPWMMAKPLLSQATIQKIHFSSGLDLTDLWKHTNKSQVEKKFGGNAPNATNFWYLV